MISHALNPAGLKPSWKGNLLLVLVTMLALAPVFWVLGYKMTLLTHDGTRHIAINVAKLPELARNHDVGPQR
jgi:hypothetical protein